MKKILFILFIISIGQLHSQEEDTLSDDYLNWQVINGNVFLEWFLAQGETCFGIDVKRRNDTLSTFEIIHQIEGFCGSQDKRVRYTFTDTSANKNQYNYYQIDLGGQSQRYSPGIWVFDIQNEVLIFPQPSNGEAIEIRFENSNKELVSLCLFSLKGEKLIEYSTKEDIFKIDLEGRGNQFLIYQLNFVDKVLRGRIVL